MNAKGTRAALLAAAVLALAAPVGLGIGAGTASAHAGDSFCHGTYVNDGHGEGRCEAPFKGFPIGVVGTYDPVVAAAPSAIHVELFAKLADGSERPLGVECERTHRGAVRCAKESNPLGAPMTAPEAAPAQIIALVCKSHSHARVVKKSKPVATFGCWSTLEGRDALEKDMAAGEDEAASEESAPGQGGALPPLPQGVDSVITAVPVNTYAPGKVVAPGAAGLLFANFDLNRHDVVASDDMRPDGSAEWCKDFEPGKCPLFWSPLIAGGGTQTPVFGLEDAEPGRSYRFYCSIHPYMHGTIDVVG